VTVGGIDVPQHLIGVELTANGMLEDGRKETPDDETVLDRHHRHDIIPDGFL
jgi:hypothetical protein